MEVLILFLLFIILALLYLLVKPIINRKFGKPEQVESFNQPSELEDKIVQAAVKMAQSKKTMMSFNDEEGLYKELAVLKSKLKGKNNAKNYAYFNFPKAWLFLGILRYGVAKSNTELIELVKRQAKNLIDTTGQLKFSFDKIDQALFGLLFIELYKETEDLRYRQAADHIYRFAQRFKTKDGLYLYRQDLNVLFIDTLGMIVPFLCAYGDLKNDQSFKDEAKRQLEAYLNFTRSNPESSHRFPCHAYDLKDKISLGSVNWARGLGWFMIGLSSVASTHGETDDYKAFFESYWEKLKQLAITDFWPQFLGHSNDPSIDASATLMFYFSKMTVCKKYDKHIDKALKHSINPEGFILNNSGDTIYINRYSSVKGKSELSQGLLLCLLAKKAI